MVPNGCEKSNRYGHWINIDLGCGGYGGKLMAGVQDVGGQRLEIVKGWDEVTGFKVVAKGWIVERTFAGLDRYRRWNKDFEYLVSPSENMIQIAMIQLMLRRLAINSTQSFWTLSQNKKLFSDQYSTLKQWDFAPNYIHEVVQDLKKDTLDDTEWRLLQCVDNH